MRVVASGVTLTPEDENVRPGEDLQLWGQVWLETEEEGAVERHWGQAGAAGFFTLGDEPTKSLLEGAQDFRDLGLGGILGDLRITANADLTPSEVYLAPFHIELDDRLQRLLSGSWHRRDPRLPHSDGPPLRF